MLEIYTSRVYNRIFRLIEKIIKSNERILANDFIVEMKKLNLWDAWCDIVNGECVIDLDFSEKRKFAFPKFVEYCSKKTIDINRI